MESIICEEMINHLPKNNILIKHQHGFLPKQSTRTQLLECINKWTTALASGKYVDLCRIDFCRAFDNVSISKLLHK